MKTEDPTGGPAYPCLGDEITCKQVGMTLLDYFAGQAMTYINTAGDYGPNIDEAAEDCYALAAVMVAEKRRRERGDSVDDN